ncbi:hypothetical protein ACHQM5_024406 [Ranunculus cassubicifolius]
MEFSLPSLKYSDSLIVVFISICTAFLCEIIYRTSSYKSLRSSIDKASKKLETMKTVVELTKKTKTKKKIDRVESSLKESTRDLSLSKFKSGAVVAVVLFVVFGLLNSLFEGKSVAKNDPINHSPNLIPPLMDEKNSSVLWQSLKLECIQILQV